MMRLTASVGALFSLHAAAYPSVLEMDAAMKGPAAAVALSKARTNCGPTPCLHFDKEAQYVDITGSHKYVAPASSDIRGPCPGLNAAANHGFLDHSGITTIQNAIDGLGAAYAMSAGLAGVLSAYAIIFDGDPVQGTWSIGGPPPSDPLTAGLLGGAQGISYSHNVYEGDSSISRPDAYLNHGNAYVLDINRFKSAYEVGMKDDRYTLDKFVRNFQTKVHQSISTNPYYFAAPFSTTLVSPAAYNFVINMMSNHTAEEPSGYLDGNIFKTFFAVTGDYPNFKWHPGQERIPENWYRRPLTNPYTNADVFGDLGVGFAAYPSTLRLGGNTNGVNTYAGVDLADLTGGAYNLSDLADYKNTGKAQCFYAEFIQAVIPNAAAKTLGELSAIDSLINDHILAPLVGNLTCAKVSKFSQTPFNKFPGYKYRPKGPATSGGP